MRHLALLLTICQFLAIAKLKFTTGFRVSVGNGRSQGPVMVVA